MVHKRPGQFQERASSAEIVEILRVAAGSVKVYIVHIQNANECESLRLPYIFVINSDATPALSAARYDPYDPSTLITRIIAHDGNPSLTVRRRALCCYSDRSGGTHDPSNAAIHLSLVL